MPGHVADVQVDIVSEEAVIEERVERVDSRGALGNIGNIPEVKQHTPIGLRRAIDKLHLGNSFSNPL